MRLQSYSVSIFATSLVMFPKMCLDHRRVQSPHEYGARTRAVIADPADYAPFGLIVPCHPCAPWMDRDADPLSIAFN